MFSSNASQVSNDANYIEDVFSTWLYTGNGSTQTITNGIDLAGEGGLVWTKGRSNTGNNWFVDTVRGINYGLYSNSTNVQFSDPGTFSGVSSTGYSINTMYGDLNASGQTYASWTFRKQPKFFDVVTYTGTGVSGRTVAHNLGSVPGCIIVKRLDATSNWPTYHRSLSNPQNNAVLLNLTNAALGAGFWTANPTSTVFSLSGDADVNVNGGSYVAYLFAHNAGGFGLTGTDNVISCGSFVQSVGGFVDLGFEPQWVLTKRASGVDDWRLFDNMRGMTMGDDSLLNPNTSGAENNSAGNNYLNPQPTGFTTIGFDSGTHIYIAIRRGPMKVPTDGTKVFMPVARTGTGSATTLTSAGFPPDLYIAQERSVSSYFGANWFDRLRGASKDIWSAYTDAEQTVANSVTGFDSMNGVVLGSDAGNTGVNYSGIQYANWNFRRAPGFFDEVCYTGTGGASQTFTHNLGVAPELVIVKNRDAAAAWESLGTALSSSQRQIYLNRTAAGVAVASGHLGWNGTDGAYKAPTSTVVYFGGDSDVGGSGVKYVAYLFASCPGVSKVGTFVGSTSPVNVDCGFTNGARFVMLKPVSGTGDWFVFDTARGISASGDPYLVLNRTAAENDGYPSGDLLDPLASGFTVNTDIMSNGATYLFLAIA